jgi:uncharacterized protein (DUF2235 family)
VLYLRGVGTAGLHAEIVFEGATGLGVDENIRSGYMFIAQNYLPEDEIFLFGFSRGAFTARSLSGLINACGVLKRQKLGDLGLAWKYYRSAGPHSPADFMKNCDSDCHLGAEIKFLGVWDTVGALGLPGELFSSFDSEKYGFHDTGPCNIVKHGCHALAVDEHRNEFVPTLWTGTPAGGAKSSKSGSQGLTRTSGAATSLENLLISPLFGWQKKPRQTASCSIGHAFLIRPNSTHMPQCTTLAAWSLPGIA